MKFFSKHKAGIKHNGNESNNDCIIEKTKICTIPIYAKIGDDKVLDENFFKRQLLEYSYYKFALNDNYNSIKDNPVWLYDGTTVFYYRVYEVRVKISYRVLVSYIGTRKYERQCIDLIEYLEWCQRADFETLQLKGVIKNIEELDEMLEIGFSKYLTTRYYNEMRKYTFSEEFINMFFETELSETVSNGYSRAGYLNVSSWLEQVREVSEKFSKESMDVYMYHLMQNRHRYI